VLSSAQHGTVYPRLRTAFASLAWPTDIKRIHLLTDTRTGTISMIPLHAGRLDWEINIFAPSAF
jgi:hypothetical protein